MNQNVTCRPGHVPVLDGKRVSGLAGCDTQRPQESTGKLDLSAGHDGGELLGRCVAGPFRVGDHAGKRRGCKLAQQCLPYHADGCKNRGAAEPTNDVRCQACPAADASQ